MDTAIHERRPSLVLHTLLRSQIEECALMIPIVRNVHELGFACGNNLRTEIEVNHSHVAPRQYVIKIDGVFAYLQVVLTAWLDHL